MLTTSWPTLPNYCSFWKEILIFHVLYASKKLGSITIYYLPFLVTIMYIPLEQRKREEVALYILNATLNLLFLKKLFLTILTLRLLVLFLSLGKILSHWNQSI